MNTSPVISVLCVADKSNYDLIPGLDLWKQARDTYNFTGSNPVITHAPCAQWSKLKAFAKVNKYEKDLAFFCLEKVQKNGGIFEHPAGSSFWQIAGIRNRVISINQHWFGLPIQKRTYLYFSQCGPLQLPLSFNAIERNFSNLSPAQRSATPPLLIDWFIACIRSKNESQPSEKK